MGRTGRRPISAADTLRVRASTTAPHERYKLLIDRFTKATKASVALEPQDEIWNTALTSLASGNPPDVFGLMGRMSDALIKPSTASSTSRTASTRRPASSRTNGGSRSAGRRFTRGRASISASPSRASPMRVSVRLDLGGSGRRKGRRTTAVPVQPVSRLPAPSSC